MSYELRSKDMDRRQQAERPDPLNSSVFSQDDPDPRTLTTPDEEDLLHLGWSVSGGQGHPD